MEQNREFTLAYQSDFLAGFTLVAVHDFHVTHRGGDAFVRHYALYGTDVCTGSPLKGCECSPI